MKPERFVNRADRRDIITALRFSGNFDEIEAFVGGDAEFRGGELVVATPQGALRASDGDWITKTWRGTFVSYPPDLFADAFRPVGSPTLAEPMPNPLFEKIEAAIKLASELGPESVYDFVHGRGLKLMREEIRDELESTRIALGSRK
jgi:hypothetical protein